VNKAAAFLIKRALGVDLSFVDPKGNLLIRQGETNFKIVPPHMTGPSDMETDAPWFYESIPPEYQKRIRYGTERYGPRRPMHTAEVRLPAEVASRHQALKEILSDAVKVRSL
jgi:hypothetical protein